MLQNLVDLWIAFWVEGFTKISFHGTRFDVQESLSVFLYLLLIPSGLYSNSICIMVFPAITCYFKFSWKSLILSINNKPSPKVGKNTNNNNKKDLFSS